MLRVSTKMLKLFPMRHQLSHRRNPLQPSSIRDVRSLLRIRFLKSRNDLHVLSFLSSLLHKMGPKSCLLNSKEYKLRPPGVPFVQVYPSLRNMTDLQRFLCFCIKACLATNWKVARILLFWSINQGLFFYLFTDWHLYNNMYNKDREILTS